MKATKLYKVIGQTGTYRFHGSTGYLEIAIRVIDARTVWGRVDYLISPELAEGASGSMWVESIKVMLNEGEHFPVSA